MAKQVRRASRDPHYWIQVESWLHCALGDHRVGRGVWVRGRRGDWARRKSCEACLKAQGIHRPVRSFTMTAEGIDVRARQAGGD